MVMQPVQPAAATQARPSLVQALDRLVHGGGTADHHSHRSDSPPPAEADFQ